MMAMAVKQNCNLMDDDDNDARRPGETVELPCDATDADKFVRVWMKVGFINFIKLSTMIIRACCHEATFSKTLAWVFFWCLFMYRNGTKNLKNLGRRFHEWKLV